MKTVKLEPKLNKEQIDKLEGTFLNETHFDTVITEDTRVLKENGEPLLVFKKNCIPANVCEQAYYSLRKAIGKTSNRAIAGGPIDAKVGDVIDGQVIGKLVGGNKYIPLKKDGTLSNTAKGKNVNSSIIGYADRYARIPYCRTTEFTYRHFDIYKKAIPYIKCISDLFKEYLPERYNNQLEYHNKTSKDFKIADTVFTTVTVNKNFRTASHYDKGDLATGFGNLTVLQTGEYEGAYTVIPKYRVAVDVRNCDLALFDVHELHGNTETYSSKPYERISIICYFREKMVQCGTYEEELQRIKHVRS